VTISVQTSFRVLNSIRYLQYDDFRLLASIFMLVLEVKMSFLLIQPVTSTKFTQKYINHGVKRICIENSAVGLPNPLNIDISFRLSSVFLRIPVGRTLRPSGCTMGRTTGVVTIPVFASSCLALHVRPRLLRQKGEKFDSSENSMYHLPRLHSNQHHKLRPKSRPPSRPSSRKDHVRENSTMP